MCHVLATLPSRAIEKCREWVQAGSHQRGSGCKAIIEAVQYSGQESMCFWVRVPMFQRRQWHPTPVLLPGKSHGQRSLVGCSPWGCEESDMTEWLHFHFSLSCIGEGNDNPLQCSCLENPRDWGAWWAAVYGVAQSGTWLKRLSSSGSSLCFNSRLTTFLLT